MHIYLVGPQSHGQSVYACLIGPFISQLWNVLLRSRVELLRLSVVCGSYRWLLVLLPVCRAFEYDRGIRLAMTVMPRVTRPLPF